MSAKTAVVIGVGAERGLGATLCRRFARAGLHAVVAGRTLASIESVADGIRRDGAQATAVPTDATSEEAVIALFRRAEEIGPVDLAIYNAGNNMPGDLLTMEAGYFERCRARLAAYAWPGNVRELQNVIERAVITAEGGRLNLDRALPEVERRTEARTDVRGCGPAEPIRTAEEMLELERANILRALEACGWKVAGEGGAAKLLGLSPSTLSSRMKALGIERPRSA